MYKIDVRVNMGQRWNDINREIPKDLENTLSLCNLSTTNATFTDLGANPGRTLYLLQYIIFESQFVLCKLPQL
jgi:hypothetical protein